MTNKKIVTRIAPSPTGLFHIGTARTALFNYLFTKKNNGKFILRIEDTDSKRSKKEYEEDIVSGLKWLGLKWDGEIFYQSKRKEIYNKYIEQLLKEKKAYKKDGATWYNLSSYPKNYIEYKDLVLGKMKFEKSNFNDFVLIKSDGIPLYMFAAVVDDHEMGMTHIIRGDDHVNSTPQQIMLYESLGFEIPNFAHIPMILNSDRTKMSKRKNPVSVSRDFRDKGYLPEAMINYISLLGWNPKNNEEFFSLNDLLENFDLSKVNKSGAIFNIEKLNYFNNHYIRSYSNEEILEKIVALTNDKLVGEVKNDKDKFIRIVEIVKERMNNLSEFHDLSYFIFQLPEYKKEILIFKKSDKEKTLQGLTSVYNTLQMSKDDIWDDRNLLNETMLEIVKANDLSNGDVFWPIRAALSGLEKSPSPTDLLWILGKDESLTRIKHAIDKLSK